MKPRIKIVRGLWYCYTAQAGTYMGLGFSPKDAFDDWKANAQL